MKRTAAPIKTDRLFASIEEGGKRYGVDPRTIRRWIEEGRIVGYRCGTQLIRIDLIETDAQLMERIEPSRKDNALTSAEVLASRVAPQDRHKAAATAAGGAS